MKKQFLLFAALLGGVFAALTAAEDTAFASDPELYVALDNLSAAFDPAVDFGDPELIALLDTTILSDCALSGAATEVLPVPAPAVGWLDEFRRLRRECRDAGTAPKFFEALESLYLGSGRFLVTPDGKFSMGAYMMYLLSSYCLGKELQLCPTESLIKLKKRAASLPAHYSYPLNSLLFFHCYLPVLDAIRREKALSPDGLMALEKLYRLVEGPLQESSSSYELLIRSEFDRVTGRASRIEVPARLEESVTYAIWRKWVALQESKKESKDSASTATATVLEGGSGEGGCAEGAAASPKRNVCNKRLRDAGEELEPAAVRRRPFSIVKKK